MNRNRRHFKLGACIVVGKAVPCYDPPIVGGISFPFFTLRAVRCCKNVSRAYENSCAVAVEPRNVVFSYYGDGRRWVV